MGSWCFRFACLLFIVGVYVGETQSEVSAEDQECIETFMEGREDFVLDTVESINDGAVFLANPRVEDSVACTVACCAHPRCNLAFVEQGNEKGCFLFNCLYKDKYVCRFFPKEGFKNFVLESVYENYLNVRKSDTDKAPIANAGRDVVVQPHEEVFLNGIESWDDGKIVKYEWSLIRGDESVQMENTDFSDQLRVSNLKPGLYEFKLTVTDSAHLSDSDQVSVLVLTREQSERNCLTPKKAGPCKGAFPRWHYNAASSKCEKFVFGGCKDNNNNYLSEHECLNACKNITVIPGGDSRKVTVEGCSTSCGEEQFKCSDGCCVNKEFECDGHQHCRDGSDENNCEQLNKSLDRLLKIGVNEKAHCTDPPDTGPCRASFTRWYYDPLNKRCHRFVFGGCDGNDNNFESTDKCMSNCSGVTEKDVFARGLFARVDDGLGESQSASVALAVVLVVGILAVLAVLGYFFLKNRRKNHQHQRVVTNSPPVALGEEHQQMVYNSTTAKA